MQIISADDEKNKPQTHRQASGVWDNLEEHRHHSGPKDNVLSSKYQTQAPENN